MTQPSPIRLKRQRGGKKWDETTITAAKRRRLVVELRTRGLTWPEIVAEVERHPELMPIPRKGRSPSYTKMQAASDCDRAMRELNAEPAENLRAIQSHQLTRVETELVRRFFAGETAAAGLLVRCMERKAKLFGLDAPQRTEIEITRHMDQLGVIAAEAVLAALRAAGLPEQTQRAVLETMESHLLAIEARANPATVIDAEPVLD